jgi:hypothetical protein
VTLYGVHALKPAKSLSAFRNSGSRGTRLLPFPIQIPETSKVSKVSLQREIDGRKPPLIQWYESFRGFGTREFEMQRLQDSSSFKSPNSDMESHAVALPSTSAHRIVQPVHEPKRLIGFPAGISVKTRSTGPSFSVTAFAYDRYSFHNGKCLYFRVSGFRDPRCQEFHVLLNPRSPMSQFTDMLPYVLALLAKLLAHGTTIIAQFVGKV